MKIAEIKRLAETYQVEELKKAEEQLLEEKTPSIEIQGDDEGEKLTHTMAAIWVLEQKEKHGVETREAVRNYTQKVRKSID